MLKKIIAFIILSSFAGVFALSAEPTPSSRKKSKKKTQKESAPIITPAKPLPEGWSLVDGVWTHSDGYKFVKGQLFRIGTHTHKRPPKPPTQAEMDAVTKKNNKRVPTAAEAAAARAAERERNLRPRPAPQTGSNL
jgi:hypothetical protein